MARDWHDLSGQWREEPRVEETDGYVHQPPRCESVAVMTADAGDMHRAQRHACLAWDLQTKRARMGRVQQRPDVRQRRGRSSSRDRGRHTGNQQQNRRVQWI